MDHLTAHTGVVGTRIVIIDGNRLPETELLSQVTLLAEIIEGARIAIAARDTLYKHRLNAAGLGCTGPCPARVVCVLRSTGVHLARRGTGPLTVADLIGADIIVRVTAPTVGRIDGDRALPRMGITGELLDAGAVARGARDSAVCHHLADTRLTGCLLEAGDSARRVINRVIVHTAHVLVARADAAGSLRITGFIDASDTDLERASIIQGTGIAVVAGHAVWLALTIP